MADESSRILDALTTVSSIASQPLQYSLASGIASDNYPEEDYCY